MDKAKIYSLSLYWFSFTLFSFVVGQQESHVSIEAPANAQVTRESVTSTSLWLTWDAVPKADSYAISLRPPTIGVNGVGIGIRETNSIITGLQPHTEYHFSIKAVIGSRQGTPTVVWQSTALPSPADVWAVEDSITQDSMTIAWTSVEGKESYTVEVYPSTGIGGAGEGYYETTVRLRGMSPNTRYTIKVSAVNYVGQGAKATLYQLTKLSSPRNLVVVSQTVTPNSIGVQWSEVVGADNYVIKIVPSHPLTGDLPRTQATRYKIRNLEPDTQYRIDVAAANGAGPSEYSSVNQKTLSICFAAAEDFQKDTFTIVCPPNCQQYQNTVYGTREYSSDSDICAAAIHDGRININVGGTVVVVKRPGILDFVGTRKNGITSKDYKNWHRSFVFALQPPEDLKIPLGSVTFNRMTVSWREVNGADAYRISADPSEGVLGIESNIQDTRVTLGGLQPNTTYRVYVTAVNRVETSDGTNIVQRTALPAPENLQILHNTVFFDRFAIGWDAMGTGRSLRYQVTVVSNGRVVLRDDTSLTSYTATNLTSGTFYNISVQALNGIGLGEAAMISQRTALLPATNLNVTKVTSTSITVAWTPSRGATHYNIYVSPISRNYTVTTAQTSIGKLQPDTLYRISITAANSHRYEQTDAITIEQRTVLALPYIEMIPETLTHEGVTLTWNQLRNATYVVSVFPVGKTEDEITFTTQSTSYNLTGLQGRTEYVVNVVARNEIGYGPNDTIAFRTLIASPSNVRVFFHRLRPSLAFIKWDEVSDIESYYVSCIPSIGVGGLGIIKGRRTILTGLTIDADYEVSVMAVNNKDNGMNKSTSFKTGLRRPMSVAIHSMVNDSVILDWDPNVFDISSISYNPTNGDDFKSVRVLDDSLGRMVFNDLEDGHTCQFNIFSNSLSELLDQSEIPQPVATQTVDIDYNSNLDKVIVFWPRMITDEEVHYLVSTSTGESLNITNSSVMLSGFRFGSLYSVSVMAKIKHIDAKSPATRISFTQTFFSQHPQSSETVPSDVNESEDSHFPAEEYDLNEFLDETDNVDDKDIQDPDHQAEKKSNSMLIPIVVVIACVLGILLLILVPCLYDCHRNKPILRNHGCCGCCYSYPASNYKRNY